MEVPHPAVGAVANGAVQEEPAQDVAVNESNPQAGSCKCIQPSTPCSSGSCAGSFGNVTGSFGSCTSEGVDCYGNERNALLEQCKFFNNTLLSDIRLKVGTKIYHSHKLVLVRSSEVFERMFSSDWSDPNKGEVELVEDPECVHIFSHFLKFLYSCHIVLNIDNTLPVLILADKYNVTDLRNVCIDYAATFIIPKLQLKDVFHVWFQYATKCYHKKLISSCVMALSAKADDIMLMPEWQPEWLQLEKDQLIEIMKSSELTIRDEFSIFLALEKWLECSRYPERQQNKEALLRELLQYVRFPMMFPHQLCAVEKSKIAKELPALFVPHLMMSYKYHSLSLENRANTKEFNSSSFLLRNYTELRWDKRFVIQNYSQLSRCSEIMPRFSTRSSTFPSSSWDWELKIHPKGFSSSNDDFRAVLYSNLIMDQVRPIEFMLSIVDNSTILKTVTGRKNFSKTRYSADSEIDKKVSIDELLGDSALLVNDNLVLQIIIRPMD
ncbi:BTB/POZ domain-containing protein 17-like [Saccoglossus kowalevskii]|uniref:Galectin-3-binding protein-like n=1 Tax=Saccoglossus kowalevskii TaxID=10224 RepID=A0ABM0GTQ5_SACKO|nr:PREDICTED: galectin-3-binding protein-like [Saccoglossus kowalevskii]